MSKDTNIWSLAEAYVSGNLPEAELIALQKRLDTNEVFANEFNECVNLVKAMNGNAEHMQYKAMVADIHGEVAEKEQKKEPAKGKTISLRTYYYRLGGVAACIALLTSITTYWAISHNNRKIASQYSVLRKDLEKYKQSQNQLIRNINNQKTAAPAPAQYTGTGFALTNDGYLVTNYHVTEGADSLYIQNENGDYYKAYTVTYDIKSDIAILKVEQKNFRFGKADLPYTIAPVKKGLGAEVFTVGFPQDDMVYAEGYISARNGYAGDSLQYELGIPANPGQSGSPVMDANGNVVAIITGKQNEIEGVTYAVSSKSLHQLLHNLPKEANLKLPKANRLARLSREQQVEKLEQYTFSVKVYKN